VDNFYSGSPENIRLFDNNLRYKFIKHDVRREDFFTIGMVAPLKKQKRPEDFLSFAKALIRKRKDVKFILVGDGELRPKLEIMAMRLKS